MVLEKEREKMRRTLTWKGRRHHSAQALGLQELLLALRAFRDHCSLPRNLPELFLVLYLDSVQQNLTSVTRQWEK